jgi:hypothetical protein
MFEKPIGLKINTFISPLLQNNMLNTDKMVLSIV